MGPYILPDGKLNDISGGSPDEYKDANSPRTTKLTGKGSIYTRNPIMKTSTKLGQWL
jgi:hypothetical protein